MDKKLLTIRAAENVIRILPPLNVKKNELDQALKIINKVCAELNKMKHFINLKDIPAKDLRRILIDAKKRKKARKKLNNLDS